MFNNGASDHLEMITGLRELQGNWHPFRVFTSWLELGEVRELVKEEWEIRMVRNSLFQMIAKLKNVKLSLKCWPLSQGDM